MVVVVFFFFFFKQKTAYEMRISDWSSDVCSSDLVADHPFARRKRGTDQALHMVGTGGGDQQRLGGDAPAVFASPQKQATNGFRSRRAPRLARGDSASSLAGEPLTEQAGLGGFAHPPPAFNRDPPPCQELGPPHPNS